MSTLPSTTEREQSIKRVCDPLPGSVPYNNLRPISVPQRCNAMTTLQWLASMHTHYSMEQWRTDIAEELLRISVASHDGEVPGDPITESDIVLAGQRYLHSMPDTVEPDVSTDIRLLYEDDSLIVVNKPAPLPIHPCGRFNRNSLTSILQAAFDDQTEFRVVHRLDASTTGIVVLCKSRSGAAELSRQFKGNEVEKFYLARVEGCVTKAQFSCDAPITDKPDKLGTRSASTEGNESRTEFELIKTFADNSSLLRAKPITGRTNQIRIHLQTLGHPIRGDEIYAEENLTTKQRTKTNDATAPPLCLHAHSITLTHPRTNLRCTWKSATPDWTS